MHVPVLLAETLEYLRIRPEGVYLDATAGLGGHTAAIAQRLTTGWVIANDCDAESLEIARRNTAQWADRVRFRHGSFSALTELGIDKVDGLLADLGASMFQLTHPERGFSIMAGGPLDMRMDRSAGVTASHLVNTMGEKALAGLIYQHGEERRARRVARAIVRARPIQSAEQLAQVVERAVPRTGRLHPATQTFMALRRAVNREDEELDALLALAPRLVASGGRIVIISFMSLEDRKVKQAFNDLVRQGRAIRLVKYVRPAEEEARSNPASRSAKLRAVELH